MGEGTYGKVYKARDKNTGRLVALKKTRLEVRGGRRRACWHVGTLGPLPGPSPTQSQRPPIAAESVPTMHAARSPTQMEEEGVPSTTLREISLLQMLSESNHIVK